MEWRRWYLGSEYRSCPCYLHTNWDKRQLFGSINFNRDTWLFRQQPDKLDEVVERAKRIIYF